MPIYEFFSPDTNRIYSFYARSLAQGREIPRCPDNPKALMERLVSQFAFTGRTKEKSSEGGDDLDPRMENVMAEMEREMASMNEENPDPRQLGRMMRKMTEATGQRMPEIMEQMIGRLERGEDPQKLEEEYGSSLEEMGEGFDIGDAVGRARKKSTSPTRDPKLYEMADFIG
jgi:hypothetical protein